MSFIGAASAFTLHQSQIDIEFGQPTPGPTHLVHICIGYGIGFMATEYVLFGGLLILRAHGAGNLLAWDVGPGAGLLQPPIIPLPPLFYFGMLGFFIINGRRTRVRSVILVHNTLVYRKYILRRSPDRPMMIPDPAALPRPFQILEYGMQVQSWRKIYVW